MTDVQQQVSRTWQQYTIMHLNRRVASIRSDGTCTIYAASFMPYNYTWSRRRTWTPG